MVDAANRQYLIRTMLGEAANQPDEGLAAVGHVILNRLKGGRYGDDIRSVVTAKSQFEPWGSAEGRARMMGYAQDGPEYQRAARIADGVLSGQIADMTGGADHFLNADIVRQRRGGSLPKWANDKWDTRQVIGDHTFLGGSGADTLAGGGGRIQFDPEKLEAARSSSAPRFDPEKLEAARVQGAPTPDTGGTGVGEAIGRGALQGATMGFSDEIYANQMPDPRQRFADALKRGMSVEEAREFANAPAMSSEMRGEIYDQQLGEVRAANEQAQEDQGAAYLGGEIVGAVGSALVPGGAAANAIKGVNTAGRALTNAGAAGLQGAAYGFGSGEGGLESRVENAVETGAISAAAGGAIPIFGKAIAALGRSRATGQAAARLREIAPAVEDLKAAAGNLFRQAERSGVVISQQTMENLSDKVWNRAINMGARAKLHPGAMTALEELRDAAAKGQATMSDLMGVRRVLQMGANDIANKDNTRIVSAIVDNFDDFMLNMKPKDFIKGGPTKEAVEEWRQARELWRRSIKAGVIEDAVERAANAKSGFENGLRDEFKAIVNPGRGGRANKTAKMFSDEELDAMRKIVRGNLTTKALRTLSKFGFGANNQSNFLGGAIGVGSGAAMAGPVGAMALPVVGQVAGRGAEKVTGRMGETVRAMVATGQSPEVPRLASSIAEKWLLQGSAALPAVQ